MRATNRLEADGKMGGLLKQKIETGAVADRTARPIQPGHGRQTNCAIPKESERPERNSVKRGALVGGTETTPLTGHSPLKAAFHLLEPRRLYP